MKSVYSFKTDRIKVSERLLIRDSGERSQETKSDARTHRTPKALRANPSETLFLFPSQRETFGMRAGRVRIAFWKPRFEKRFDDAPPAHAVALQTRVLETPNGFARQSCEM
jgi:hypothetical protein